MSFRISHSHYILFSAFFDLLDEFLLLLQGVSLLGVDEDLLDCGQAEGCHFSDWEALYDSLLRRPRKSVSLTADGMNH